MKRKGVGVEDTPFMVLAAVAVIMMVTWIGINVMATFVEGNERQTAIQAATDIYKLAKLASLGYDGSSERISVSVPEGYAIEIDGRISVLSDAQFANGTLMNSTLLSEPLVIRGVEVSAEPPLLPPGDHDLLLTYHAEDGKVVVYRK